MTTAKLLLAAILGIALLAGCGGSGGGSSGGVISIDPSDDSGTNEAPTITSLSPQGTTASPIRIQAGKTQILVVAATDPDKDNLTYTWSTDNGQVTGNSPSADYVAPQSACTSIVTVKVSDGNNHTVSAKCCFTVYKDDEPDPPDPEVNEPPVISDLTADPNSVKTGETSNLTAVATDPDGDELTYSWSASGGSIQSSTGNTAVWKAPSTADGCTVTVSVSDGNNPAVTKSVAITVDGADDPVITNGLAATYVQNDHDVAHPDLSKGTVVFTRIDANINFDWGRKAPDPSMVTDETTENGSDYGVIWNGYIKCEKAGAYQFKAVYDDGFRLWVSDDSSNMQMVIDGWYTGPLSSEGQITLEGSKWYKLEAQYFADQDRSYIQLYWLPPGETEWSIVPTDALRTE
ncbi:MAG: PA14 domain-containing protein [Armatimonadota bacterium]